MKKKFTLLLLLFVAVFAIWFKSHSGKQKPSVESFFNESDKTNFQLSPNGRFVSFIQPYKGIENLYVMDLASDVTERITNEDDVGIRFSFWANDDEIIFVKYHPLGDSLRLMAVNKDVGALRYILPPADANMRWVGPPKVDDKGKLLLSLNSRDSSVFDVYRLHITDCTLELVAENPGNITEWLPDEKGEVRIAIATDGNTETTLFRMNEKEPFVPVIHNNFKSSVQPLGFSSKNENHIFALSNLGRDKKALVEVDMISGKEQRVLFAHQDVDVSRGGYSEKEGKMDFAIFKTWKTERHFFNEELEEVYAAISNHLKGYLIDIEGIADNYSKFLVRASTDVDPGTYYIYDRKENILKKLCKINDSLQSSELSPTVVVNYLTNDGMKIQAYLTLPKNLKKEMLPVIVIPHDGPSARSVWGYDAEVQFLVSRGFAVFQPNYRGSTGYGKAFWIAGFKEWGKKIQDDIKDGVEFLIEQGVADPQKIGIYGFNFGGYAALHGACFNPQTYSCAASYSGITNLYTYLKEFPPYFTPYMEKYYEIVGNPKVDGDYLRSSSPVFHAEKITIPLFIAQGGKDNRNNVNETNFFIKKLRKNNVDITYMLKEEEDNLFRKDKNKVDFYRELASFFQKKLLK